MKREIKIAMLLDNSFVSDARVEKELETLLNEGYSITVMCCIEIGLPEQEQRNGYTILRIIESGYNAPLRKTYKKYIDTIVNEILNYDFEILQCHDFYMLSIGAETKRRRPTLKLIYDSHEYLKGWPFYKSSTGLNKWKGKIVWKKLIQKEKEDIKSADTVLTITEGIAERLQLNCNLKTKPVVVGNYPKKMDLNITKGYFHTKYNINSNKRILVHTGTIYHTDSQLSSLMNMVKDNDSIALVFIGNRTRFYAMKSLVENNENFSKKIFFHPYPKNQEETINIIGAADIGLLHLNNDWEAHQIGFSNRFVEYIMAEIPVVATPQEFTREFNLKYNCCSFYNGNKPIELSSAINEIVNKYDEYKLNVITSRGNLNWELESEKLTNLYESISQ